MKIKDKLKDKRILIWGYGLEGKTSEEFIKNYCDAKVLEIFEGKYSEIDENQYDYIIKSPGIPYLEKNPKMISQTSLFLEEFKNQVIGVTGTKGKSTTSSLLYHVLKEAGKDTILVGNIGLPPLARYEDISKDTIIVFEMSAHQLSMLEISPHISIYLNLYEDHLDYYKIVEEYHKAKSNIALHQNVGDYFFVGENVPDIDTKATKFIMPFDSGSDLDIKSLDGNHNKYNSSIVAKIATNIYNLKLENVIELINTFKGLPHRMQRVHEENGVVFYDDSISTICQSAILAARSIENTGTVLIGGMDRGIDYSSLIDFIVKNNDIIFICMYESGKRVYDQVKESNNCYYCENLKEAVTLAKELTPKGKACILSPAAASYGYFKNFEERGKVFTALVKQ